MRRRQDEETSIDVKRLCIVSVDPQRWSRFGLIRNPFGELTIQERAEVAIVDFKRWDSLVGMPGVAIQFVGECGRGKTTRMLAIAARFPDARYVYLAEDGRIPAIPDGMPLLIDEAQRLPRRIRNAILASGVSLVLATHRDLRRALVRYNYRVSYRTNRRS